MLMSVATVGSSFRVVVALTRMEPDRGHSRQESSHPLEFTPLLGTLAQNRRPHRPRRRGHSRRDGRGRPGCECWAAAGGRDAAGWSGVAARRAAPMGSAVGVAVLGMNRGGEAEERTGNKLVRKRQRTP